MNLSLATQSFVLALAMTSTTAQHAGAAPGTRGEALKGQQRALQDDISMSLSSSAALFNPDEANKIDVASTAMMKKGKGNKKHKANTFSAPHEVHQFEQVKFKDEAKWECEEDTIGGVTGCMKCRNPGSLDDEALVVEVKAMYKRPNFNLKGDDPVRQHCIFPKRGYFWTCFNSNLVIEPASEWLGELKDKPIYALNTKNEVAEGGKCLSAKYIKNASLRP